MGEDEDASTLKELSKAPYFYKVPAPKYSADHNYKSRIISRNQQMMRLDSEITKDLSMMLKMTCSTNWRHTWIMRSKCPDFEDYTRGINRARDQKRFQLCKKHLVITAADPKRKNFSAMRE